MIVANFSTGPSGPGPGMTLWNGGLACAGCERQSVAVYGPAPAKDPGAPHNIVIHFTVAARTPG